MAASILARFFREHQPLEKILAEMCVSIPDKRDRAFIQELCYGVARWFFCLDFILDKMMVKPFKNRDLDIKALLLCGLYQMDYLRTPEHASVSATVEATIQLQKPWAKKVVNAILRRYQREHNEFQRMVNDDTGARYAHPGWLINQLKQDWPDHWQNIITGNNQRPPMHLRVNRLFRDRDAYLKEFRQAGLEATALPLNNCGICLSEPVDVELLPGFREGHVSVQDLGAQFAAELLDLSPGQHILDACAAPGGKTAHIFECQPDLAGLTAVEYDKQRVSMLRQTTDRLHIKADIIHADARDTGSWWDGTLFDRILLDAPCTATGVIRRHPDIRISRQPGVTSRYTDTQYQILESVWPLLKHKGKLVYATCSVLNQENDAQIERFTNNHSGANPVELDTVWGFRTTYGRQTLPGYDDTDGFYYAMLEKTGP